MIGDDPSKSIRVKVYVEVRGPAEMLPEVSLDMKNVKWLI